MLWVCGGPVARERSGDGVDVDAQVAEGGGHAARELDTGEVRGLHEVVSQLRLYTVTADGQLSRYHAHDKQQPACILVSLFCLSVCLRIPSVLTSCF